MGKKKQAKKENKAIKYEGGADWYFPAGPEDMLSVSGDKFTAPAFQYKLAMKKLQDAGGVESIIKHMIEAENGNDDC